MSIVDVSHLNIGVVCEVAGDEAVEDLKKEGWVPLTTLDRASGKIVCMGKPREDTPVAEDPEELLS